MSGFEALAWAGTIYLALCIAVIVVAGVILLALAIPEKRGRKGILYDRHPSVDPTLPGGSSGTDHTSRL